MATRVVTGLGILAAVIAGLWADAPEGSMAFLAFAMVVLGAAYAVMNVDAAKPQAFLVTGLVVWAAGGADVLGHVYAIGDYLDAILDQVAVLYLSGGAAIFATRAYNAITKGSV